MSAVLSRLLDRLERNRVLVAAWAGVPLAALSVVPEDHL